MAIEPRFYKIERDGPVLVWKFSHPPQNLATIESGQELVELVQEFDKDPELRVGIITSATPGMFIQHFDVSSILDWAENLSKASEEEVAQQMSMLPPPQGIGSHTSKPLICAINGPVEGGGCEMALGCDIRFIARDAFMGQPEVNAGFPPGGGGTQRLARLLGVGKALELCLTGRRIYADEAERLDLVTKACDPEELMPTVMAFAQALAARPPVGVSIIKKAIYEGVDMTLQKGLILERKLFFEAIRSKEAVELMRLYVSTGQDREKLAAMLEDQQQD
ncbi:MAG: enoyl-CoA hydratase/isomerase family protein [Deltaproteobacteria bacterium]|nr:enoyl-CoA hydratase/isomerase family protein [Deltaproteobacteria bacterium]